VANLAYFLEALALVEAPDRVPVLLGAAQTLHERTDHKSYGYYRPDESRRQQVERQTRLMLGDDAYAVALETGRSFDVPAIVRYAAETSA
jgi:hypothetical protein